MKRLIDISFTYHSDTSLPQEAIEAHKGWYTYIQFLKTDFDTTIIEHANYESKQAEENISYAFLKGRKSFWHIPFKTISYVKSKKPDFIIVQGLIFPLQVIFLNYFLNKDCVLIVQHHGEQPFKGLKKVLQKIADKFIDAYLFTSTGNARDWLDKKIIHNQDKCYEILEASTHFVKLNQQESRKKLSMGNNNIFLWVGRLEKNKDPITILKGFEKYVEADEGAQLYMIYQETDLLAEVTTIINSSRLLKKTVIMVGKIEHDVLPDWFSAADYYLSGSHREAAGYALIEAMACGCIPVVTDIPPFRKIAGDHGFFFKPGDPNSLYTALEQVSHVQKEQFSGNIASRFNEHLSFKKIAEDITKLCNTLTIK